MTRQRIKEIATKNVPGWIIIAGSIIPLVAVLAGAARYAKAAVDSTYVSQAAYALDRQRDSLNNRADMREIRDGIAALRAACRQSGECKP